MHDGHAAPLCLFAAAVVLLSITPHARDTATSGRQAGRFGCGGRVMPFIPSD